MAFQQDFTPVVLGNRKGGSGSSKTTGGGSRELSGPKKPQSTGLNGKLDNSTAHKLDSADAKAPETVGLEVGKAIAKARNDKGWKVPDLATAINQQKGVITELESGKHPRDNKLLQMLEGKLGIWLTGDTERLGQPKTRGKKGAEEPKPAPVKASSAKDKEKKVETVADADSKAAPPDDEGASSNTIEA